MDIEFTKADIEKVNWIRDNLGFEEYSNYHILKHVLNVFYYVEKERYDMEHGLGDYATS